MEKHGTGRIYIRAVLAAVLLVLIDQGAKLLAVRRLKGQPSLKLIPGVFELQYLENRGAAFGIFQDQRAFFLIMTVLILLLAVWCFAVVPKTGRYLPLRVCMVFVVAGALGNFLDRLFRGYVVDFFSFVLINFPVFNIADIYITVSFAVLVLLVFFYYKDEELLVFSGKYRREQREKGTETEEKNSRESGGQ
ncbi:MAG TPA: signal peptidase II [Candidatus Bariatricus faecipullorum]|nr:signal peptidase II [Candidatus Bariatricus faecipullorum]